MRIRCEKIHDFILFLLIWISFSLNAQYLGFPGGVILRWILPIVLVFFTILGNKGKITYPPMFLIMFTVAILPSIFNSINLSTSVEKVISFILIIYSCYIFFTYSISRIKLDKYLKIYANIVIIYQILNVIFIIGGNGMDNGRAVGITTNANTLGIYSNIAFWTSYFLFISSISSFKKLIYIVLCFSSVYTTILSGSRTAFIVLILNLLLVVIVKFRKSKFFIPFLLILFIFVYIVMTGKISFLRIIALDRLVEEGTNRGELWDMGIKTWKQCSLFGCGYGISAQINIFEKGLAFHNSYLSLLVECGLFGILIIILAISNIIKKMFFYSKIVLHHYNINSFVIATFIVLNIAITAWGESFLFAVGSTEGFSFWFLISWLLAYMKMDDKYL